MEFENDNGFPEWVISLSKNLQLEIDEEAHSRDDRIVASSKLSEEQDFIDLSVLSLEQDTIDGSRDTISRSNADDVEPNKVRELEYTSSTSESSVKHQLPDNDQSSLISTSNMSDRSGNTIQPQYESILLFNSPAVSPKSVENNSPYFKAPDSPQHAKNRKEITDLIARELSYTSQIHDSPGPSSEKSSSQLPWIDDKRQINVYQRILGRKSSTAISNTPHLIEEAALSVSNMKDRLFSFMSGESENERKTRVKLVWYRNLMTDEITLFNRIKQHHMAHRRELLIDFEDHELLLQRRGMFHVLPSFRIQAWMRISRARLLEEMAVAAAKAFDQRAEKGHEALLHFTANRSGGDFLPLDSYNDFSSVTPEMLLAKHQRLCHMGYRLSKFDRVCTTTMNAFRKSLPGLEALSSDQQRSLILQDIINSMKYNDDNDQGIDKGWLQYSRWYSERQDAVTKISAEFCGFVEDEREREGRLFKRWCNLALGVESSNSVAGRSDKSSAETSLPQYRSYIRIQGRKLSDPLQDRRNSASIGTDSGASKLTSAPSSSQSFENRQPSAKKTSFSPKSALAFIKYFAEEILASKYKITDNKDALIVLTEELVFKRIHRVAFRYPNISLQTRDEKWRNKCKACINIDPTLFGVPEVFIPRPDSGYINDKDSLSSLSWIRLSAPPRLDIGSKLSYQYSRNSRVLYRSSSLLRQISSCTSPRDMTFNLLQGVRWMFREAESISMSKDPIGADLMFPLLVTALLHAKIPNIHLVLHYLLQYSNDGQAGEAAYYTTCLHAAAAFIIRFQIEPNMLESYSFVRDRELKSGDGDYKLDNSSGDIQLNFPSKDSEDTHTIAHVKSEDANDEKAILKLSEWVRDQNTMEETITILQEEGWMV